jgi:hypothetical protein
MLIPVTASVRISVPTGSVTANVPGSVPALPRSFCIRPNHIPKMGRSVSLTTIQIQSRGLRSTPCPISSTRGSQIRTRESCISHEFRTIIHPEFVNLDSTRWKRCAPVRRICSVSPRSQPRALRIVSKNIELNERSRGRSTRRRSDYWEVVCAQLSIRGRLTTYGQQSCRKSFMSNDLQCSSILVYHRRSHPSTMP